MNEDLQQQLIKDLIIESLEGLDQFDQELLIIERGEGPGEPMNRIFRIVHTIKGTSGCFGLSKIEALAHVGESLLSLLREGKIRGTSQIVSALLSMSDSLREMFRSLEANGSEGSKDYSALANRLQALQNQTSIPAPVTKIEQAFGLFDEEDEPANPPPSVAPIPQASVDLASEPPSTPSSPVSEEAHGEKQTPQRQALSETAIRVDVGHLDRLMNLVGELVLARNQILQFTAHSKADTLTAAAQRLDLITTELQESVMKTRLQPIGNLLARFPRIVRDLSQELGKQVELMMSGNETELDRSIIESIKDPLTHLLRNAIDHGIETPEVRRRAGKPETGSLLIGAYHMGGQVNIEIIDDGAGINVSRVKQKALSTGLITPDQAARMSDREAFHLIFRPGFSTAEKVTNVSGRGVGMDVVKTNIEKVGGSVEIQSEAGKGATFRIKIPLTLAIIPALIVTSATQHFAIPQVSLVELLRLEPEAAAKSIEHLYGQPFYRLRGNLLPLAFLEKELHLQRTEEQIRAQAARAVNIVVLQADGNQFGVVVDQITDTEEIVVKPLGKNLKDLSCFAGATIMGDGSVALIIDVMGLAQQAHMIRTNREPEKTQETASEAWSTDNQSRLLLFEIGQSDSMAIPLSMVSRLEEFERSAIEHACGQTVIQYRGELLPLVQVSDHVPTRSGQEDPLPSTMQVVVYSQQGRSVGLVVGRIQDIIDQAVVTRLTTARRGILGTAVVNNKVTTVLEAAEIIEDAAVCFSESALKSN